MQDAEFAKRVSHIPAAHREAVAREAVAYAQSLGVSEPVLTHLLQTNPVMRTAAFRQMMFDAAAGSLSRKNLEVQRQKQRAANIPHVTPPGHSNNGGRHSQNSNLKALSSKLNQTNSVKDAVALFARAAQAGRNDNGRLHRRGAGRGEAKKWDRGVDAGRTRRKIRASFFRAQGFNTFATSTARTLPMSREKRVASASPLRSLYARTRRLRGGARMTSPLLAAWPAPRPPNKRRRNCAGSVCRVDLDRGRARPKPAWFQLPDALKI